VSRFRYPLFFAHYLHAKNAGKTSVIFCKSLYSFLILKIIFLWPVLQEMVKYSPYKFVSWRSHFFYAPIKLAQANLDLFLVAGLVLLAIALVVRVNYFTALLICWLSFCLTRLTGFLASGSEQVLNLFLLLSLFLSQRPVLKTETLRSAQVIISNFAFLLCRIQLALIYAVSGVDKLFSKAWRSGDAVYSIMHLEFFFNPVIPVDLNEWMYKILAWAVILFELSFPILIWYRRFRLPFLILGVIFHLGIFFFLSLPDFGVVMILTYTIFLPGNWEREIGK